MKKIAIALATTAVLTTSALAADLPAREPIYKAAPMAPAYSWSGCYVGAGGGYGMFNRDNVVFDSAGVFDSSTQTSGGRGYFGTAQLGCDYQVAPSWIVGVFGDYDFGNIKGDVGTLDFSVIGQQKLTSKWAVGARFGYIVVPQLVTYVAGGWTQAHFDAIHLDDVVGLNPEATIAARNSNGWFIGTGYEYRLGFLSPNLTWKTEYRFSQFGKERNIAYFPDGTIDIQLDTKTYTQEIRSELVWRFGWGG